MKASTSPVETSVGHIAFSADGAVEYYEQAGQVFRAPVANAFDVDGRRHGRWEGTRAWFERYRARFTEAA